MIETMKFLNLTGPQEEIDRVADIYLSRYEIHLENALSQLKTVRDLRPFAQLNPYLGEYRRAKELMEQLPAFDSPVREVSLDQALESVRSLNETLSALTGQKEELEKKLEVLVSSQNQVMPFIGLNYDIAQIKSFKSIRYRFGRVEREYFSILEHLVNDSLDSIMFKCQEDEKYIWIVYFVPAPIARKVDAVYLSMHFERLFLSDEYQGTPTEVVAVLKKQIAEVEASVQKLEQDIRRTLESKKEELAGACRKLERYTENFDVRKLAACTSRGSKNYFILCGWIGQKDAEKLQKDMEKETELFLTLEDTQGRKLGQPPTKLSNPPLFRPFELFIQMYGLPDYGEFDPTILIGLTYSFLFGFMFGDVGQGLLLLVGGFLLYRIKNMKLAAIVSCCGFFSTIFGFLFGSVFGFEDIIDAVWLRPGQAMTTLPFIGKLNTVFIITVALGMGIIMLTMVINIINSLRSHDTEKTWFDTNGAAGLVFYLSLTGVVVLFMTGKPLPGAALTAVMFGVPLLLIFLKEPLTSYVQKKGAHIEGGKGMFFVQGFFELFEVLLSYFSNTISFVRVGAFAVSHAAMMEVVLMLAGYESGNINWVVVVLGNLFVCGMEGLIVGIQVLRLEYYELFSRFYRGTGRPFQAYGIQK